MGDIQYDIWAMVVTQLVQWSLPTPVVCYSNPVISRLLHRTFLFYKLYLKD